MCVWRWVAAATVALWMQSALAEDLTAADIIRKAMEHCRGQTSYAEMTMIIHRPDWQRQMTMRAWTEGDKQTLVRITEPAIDLPLALALVSSLVDRPLGRVAAWGEVGLTGEVRTVPHEARRREEANRLGVERIVGPADVGSIGEALAWSGLLPA